VPLADVSSVIPDDLRHKSEVGIHLESRDGQAERFAKKLRDRLLARCRYGVTAVTPSV
jgi:hypothetical protein